MQAAGCRLWAGGKIQIENIMQTVQIIEENCRLQSADCRPGVKCRLYNRGQVQTVDYRPFDGTKLQFPLLRANCKQAKQSVL